MDSPLFEVVTAAADVAARRLTTAAYVAATMTAPPSNTVLESYIDEVSAKLAQYCGLASNAGGTPPTFASEALRATWFNTSGSRDTRLLLPWRVPVTTITSVIEEGVTLVADTEYRILPGAMLLRLSSDTPIEWSTGKIVVLYTAGWAATLSTNAPADIQSAVAEQVKYRAWSTDRDPALRSESEPDVYTGAWSVPGGDSIGRSGFLLQVEAAFAPYRNIAL